MTWSINFWGKKEIRVFHQDDEVAYKHVVRMFRELTHEKPPRGRPGRQLPQDDGLCVIVHQPHRAGTVEVAQTQRTFEQEMHTLLEQKNTGLNSQQHTNDTDLERLQKEHQKNISQGKVLGAARQLSDLMTGLMGLGAENLRIENVMETYAWRPPKYQAVFDFDNFVVTIKEKDS